MAKTDFKSVDQYIAAQPEAVREILGRVRGIIRRAIPKAEEVISYQIPAYKLPGGAALFFAGWKAHYSLYPATDHVVGTLKDELATYKISRGTIRFPLSEPVPAKLIERIARLRAQEVAGQGEAQALAGKSAARAKTQVRRR